MATVVYRDAYFWVNGVDYSSDVSELSFSLKAEMLDETAMGDDTRIHKGGLKVWDLSAKFHQDFSTGHVGALAGLFALVGTTTCIEMRPFNSCSTFLNPSYIGIGILEAFPPMAGAVGSLLEVQASFQSAGSLTRASSS